MKGARTIRMVTGRYRIRAFVATMFAFSLAACNLRADQGDHELGLFVTAVESQDRQWLLHVELAFRGVRPVMIDKSLLPWGIRDALLIVPVVADPFGTRIDEVQYIDDPRYDFAQLKPGDELNGDVDLRERFPGLSQAVARNDVIVFWSYQLRPVDGPAFPRLIGAVLIPRTRVAQ